MPNIFQRMRRSVTNILQRMRRSVKRIDVGLGPLKVGAELNPPEAPTIPTKVTYEYCQITFDTSILNKLDLKTKLPLQAVVEGTNEVLPQRAYYAPYANLGHWYVKAFANIFKSKQELQVLVNEPQEEIQNHYEAVEKLAEKLKADGWEYIGKGEKWYNYRFRRPVPTNK